MAVAGIDYDDCKQSSYKAIRLSYQKNGKHVTKNFKSGNMIVDHYDYMKWLSNRDDAFYSENPHIVWSSSWDHFFTDGNRYEQKYINLETMEFVDWRKALEPGATAKDHELYRKCCNNEFVSVVCLKQHKTFEHVKRYYKERK